MRTLRKRLKEKRVECGYTQKTFAEFSGMSMRTYQNIEQSVCFPRKKNRELIMRIFEDHSLALFDEEDSN